MRCHPFTVPKRGTGRLCLSSFMFCVSCRVCSHVGPSRDPGCGLSFRCTRHLGNPIKIRLESGYCLLCTSHGPCCLSSNHQVPKDWVPRIVSALCGGIWADSWERDSHVQDLRAIFSRYNVILSDLNSCQTFFSYHVSTSQLGLLE